MALRGLVRMKGGDAFFKGRATAARGCSVTRLMLELELQLLLLGKAALDALQVGRLAHGAELPLLQPPLVRDTTGSAAPRAGPVLQLTLALGTSFRLPGAQVSYCNSIVRRLLRSDSGPRMAPRQGPT